MTLVGPVTTGWLLERPNWLLHKFRTGMLTEAVEFWTYSLQFHHTRIMIYKGMVYKRKYWIFEKNKGVPVSKCRNF